MRRAQDQPGCCGTWQEDEEDTADPRTVTGLSHIPTPYLAVPGHRGMCLGWGWGGTVRLSELEVPTWKHTLEQRKALSPSPRFFFHSLTDVGEITIVLQCQDVI